MKSVMIAHAVRKTDLRYWLPLLAMVSVSSSQCNLTMSQGQMTGRVTGISCLEYSYPDVTFAQCTLHCYPQAQCRVAYLKCQNSSCFCVLCPGVEDIDFSVDDEEFFLKGRSLAENVAIPIPPGKTVSIPGGLFAGQLIVAKVVLASSYTAFYFNHSNGDVALLMSIRLYSHLLVRNSKINGHWGPEEISSPHFNFAPGQEIEVMYIITQAEYKVYIDKLLFFTYQHRLHVNLASIEFFLISGGGTGGNCKSLFVII